MDLIFNFIGKPTAVGMSFVTDGKARLYLDKFDERPPGNLRERYPEGHDDALEIITSML